MGRRLDKAVAELLGHKVVATLNGELCIEVVAKIEGRKILSKYPVPHYSTDGNDMLELDREMQKRKWDLTVWRESAIFYAVYERTDKDWTKEDVNYVSIGVPAKTMPEAVSLAAYKALKGEEWSEEREGAEDV